MRHVFAEYNNLTYYTLECSLQPSSEHVCCEDKISCAKRGQVRHEYAADGAWYRAVHLAFLDHCQAII